MRLRRLLKIIHLASTLWFLLCAGYVLIISLVRAGKSWWFITSVGGYSAPIIFVLISLYLFAIFRDFARSQNLRVEHPLTTSYYYLIFYYISPFLGAAAGAIAGAGTKEITNYLMTAASGTLWMTAMVWVVIDPLAGAAEMLLASSRRHRRKRVSEAKIASQEKLAAQRKLFYELEAKEKHEKRQLNEALRGHAKKLTELLTDDSIDEATRESKAVEIGIAAWQMGGLNCMRYLHSMAMEEVKDKQAMSKEPDYISIWWDGIGTWRDGWLEGECKTTV